MTRTVGLSEREESPRLAGKAALVTGGARRIGRAIAAELAKAGVRIVIHYNRSRKEAEDLAASICNMGVDAWIVRADLASAVQRRKMFEMAVCVSGGLDFLVNNASVFPEGQLRAFDEKTAFEIFRINTFAPWDLAVLFEAQGRAGCIVNILDSRITRCDAQHAAYHLSKKMLFALTRMMAIEFAPAIRVNAVAPGLILAPRGKDEQWMKRFAKRNLLAKTGSPQHVADAVRFLLSNDFITGQVVYVDGGEHVKGGVYG